MQTLKVTAFWIRPPCAGEALGGNPQACAYTGGRIQKGWVSAHDAALEGLGHLSALHLLPIKGRPDFLPVSAQGLPRDLAVRLLLDGKAELWAGLPVVLLRCELREVHAANAELPGKDRDTSRWEAV